MNTTSHRKSSPSTRNDHMEEELVNALQATPLVWEKECWSSGSET